MTDSQRAHRGSSIRSPIATQAQVAAEPAPFPITTAARPIEAGFPDWRLRLVRNLARRSDSRWDPLTRIQVAPAAPNFRRPEVSSRPFEEYRETALWAAVEVTLSELTASREVSLNTAPEYVIGYLCRELVAKKLITPRGIQP